MTSWWDLPNIWDHNLIRTAASHLFCQKKSVRKNQRGDHPGDMFFYQLTDVKNSSNLFFLSFFPHPQDPPRTRLNSTDFLDIMQTCRQLLAFCELRDSLQQDLEWDSCVPDLDGFKGGLNQFRTATCRVSSTRLSLRCFWSWIMSQYWNPHCAIKGAGFFSE